MTATPPIKVTDLYELLPSADHQTGDIWRGLPAFGLNQRKTVSGIIITPACDLANRKCETLTYLPIIPVVEYFGSSAFRYECWQDIQPILLKSELFDAFEPPTRFGLPKVADIRSLINSIDLTSPKKISDAERVRLNAYADYIESGERSSIEHVEKLLKADSYSKFQERIIKNALKSDTHFLPSDQLPAETSAVSQHSVALFRWPMTVYLETLDIAQEATISQWKSLIASGGLPAGGALFTEECPIKLSTLRGAFLGDLLSRYLSMYIRLGSADFTEAAVKKMAKELRTR